MLARKQRRNIVKQQQQQQKKNLPDDLLAKFLGCSFSVSLTWISKNKWKKNSSKIFLFSLLKLDRRKRQYSLISTGGLFCLVLFCILNTDYHFCLVRPKSLPYHWHHSFIHSSSSSSCFWLRLSDQENTKFNCLFPVVLSDWYCTHTHTHIWSDIGI